MYEKGTHRIYVTVPERIFVQMQKVGLLKDIDIWATNLIIEEVEKRNEELKDGWKT